jgi:hypothetical protein
MDPKGNFVHESVGPYLGHELVLWNYFPGALDERFQYGERSASEANWVVTLQQELLRWKEPERAE